MIEVDDPTFRLAADQGDAVISPCRRYRYTLGRGANYGKGLVNFVLLNPSTADARKDDPTIRRLIGFAETWGYGGIVVTNLFAFRATDPSFLRDVPDPVGPDNDRHILEAARRCPLVVAGWGVEGPYRGRSPAVRRLLAGAGVRLHALKLTKHGEPRHPLYLPGDTTPFLLEPEPRPHAGS